MAEALADLEAQATVDAAVSTAATAFDNLLALPGSSVAVSLVPTKVCGQLLLPFLSTFLGCQSLTCLFPEGGLHMPDRRNRNMHQWRVQLYLRDWPNL